MEEAEGGKIGEVFSTELGKEVVRPLKQALDGLALLDSSCLHSSKQPNYWYNCSVCRKINSIPEEYLLHLVLTCGGTKLSQEKISQASFLFFMDKYLGKRMAKNKNLTNYYSLQIKGEGTAG